MTGPLQSLWMADLAKKLEGTGTFESRSNGLLAPRVNAV